MLQNHREDQTEEMILATEEEKAEEEAVEEEEEVTETEEIEVTGATEVTEVIELKEEKVENIWADENFQPPEKKEAAEATAIEKIGIEEVEMTKTGADEGEGIGITAEAQEKEDLMVAEEVDLMIDHLVLARDLTAHLAADKINLGNTSIS